jgi:hypothetical protein
MLDWEMPGLQGTEVCRRIRERAASPRPYVMLITARNRQRDLLEGLEAGADDLIVKPYAPEELLARARVASRLLSPPARSSSLTLAAFEEALASPGGEVVVRRDEAVGRIFVQRGRVAWVHVSTEPGSLGELIDPEAGISKDELRAVVEECQRTRRSFSEVLVEWGLTDRARLRERLKRWASRKLQLILHLEHPSVVFIPGAREYADDLTFSLDELALRDAPERPANAAESLLDAAPASASAFGAAARAAVEGGLLAGWSRGVEAALRLEGAFTAAVFDTTSGACLEQQGEPIDLDLARAQLRLVNMLHEREPFNTSSLVSDSTIHFVCGLPLVPGKVLYVALKRDSTSLAMAQLQLVALSRGFGG